MEEWIGGLWSNLATTIIDQEKEDEVEEIKKEENNIVEETKNEEVKKEEENNNQKLDENNQKESEVNEEIKKEENNIVEENKKEEVKKEEVKPKKKFVFKKKGTTKSPANDNKNESDDGKPQIKQIKPAPLPEIRITTKIMEEGSLGDYSSNLIPLQFDDVHSFRSNIKSARWLTEEEAVKQVVEITLDLSLMHRHNDHSLFEAGDSIAIHSPNPPVCFSFSFHIFIINIIINNKIIFLIKENLSKKKLIIIIIIIQIIIIIIIIIIKITLICHFIE